jgi:hypothetical protein
LFISEGAKYEGLSSGFGTDIGTYAYPIGPGYNSASINLILIGLIFITQHLVGSYV